MEVKLNYHFHETMKFYERIVSRSFMVVILRRRNLRIYHVLSTMKIFFNRKMLWQYYDEAEWIIYVINGRAFRKMAAKFVDNENDFTGLFRLFSFRNCVLMPVGLEKSLNRLLLKNLRAVH